MNVYYCHKCGVMVESVLNTMDCPRCKKTMEKTGYVEDAPKK